MDGSLSHSLREDRWLDVVSQTHTSKELLVSLSRMLENEREKDRDQSKKPIKVLVLVLLLIEMMFESAAAAARARRQEARGTETRQQRRRERRQPSERAIQRIDHSTRESLRLITPLSYSQESITVREKA